MMIDIPSHAVGFLLPAAVALIITSAVLLCVCANRKRKAILRSDIPLEINGIRTISRKAQSSYDSDQFRNATSGDGSVGHLSQNRRLPERPVSLIDPGNSSPTPSSPGPFSLPSASQPSLHRQLPPPDSSLSCGSRSSSKKRKAPEIPPTSAEHERDTATSSDIDQRGRDEEEDEDEAEDRTYAKVKITTKKIRKKQREDHPYAKIKEAPTAEFESDSDGNDSAASDELPQIPRVLSPQPRAPTTSNEAAAGHCVAGRASSSADLTFMTPPARQSAHASEADPRPLSAINAVLPVAENSVAQAHFSGDSQDSRGYTSISVREPLAHIRAQMALAARVAVAHPNGQESPYASVIEDSDDMYAAIDSGGGSETYAQIELPPVTEESYYQPQPPSVRSLRSAVQSSQARYRISSPPVLALGLSLNSPHAGIDVVDSTSYNHIHDLSAGDQQHSPLPERRVLNSPLPPTPTPPIERREDVYAKVTGKTRPSLGLMTSTKAGPSPRNSQSHKRIKSDTLSMLPSAAVAFVGACASPSTSLSNVSSPRPNTHHEVNYSDFEVVRDGLVPVLQLQHPRRSGQRVSMSAVATSLSESDVDPAYETIGKHKHAPLPTPPPATSAVVVPSGDVYAQIQVSQKRNRLPACPPPALPPIARDPSPEPSDTYATLNLLGEDDPGASDDIDDPNYERLASDYGPPTDFGYERVKEGSVKMGDDETGSRSGVRFEADYESLGYNRIRRSSERDADAVGSNLGPGGEPGYEEIRVQLEPDLVGKSDDDDDENYERVDAADSTPPSCVDDATELYDDGYERLHPKNEERCATSLSSMPAPAAAADVYAVVDTKSKASSSATKRNDEKVLCRLMELPPVERARKVENKPRARDESNPALTPTNMTVVTINDDEISIRNHLKEELPLAPATSTSAHFHRSPAHVNGPVQLVVHSPGIFEDVTLQL